MLKTLKIIETTFTVYKTRYLVLHFKDIKRS